jgi:hypothetical protein
MDDSDCGRKQTKLKNRKPISEKVMEVGTFLLGGRNIKQQPKRTENRAKAQGSFVPAKHIAVKGSRRMNHLEIGRRLFNGIKSSSS